MSRPGPRAKDAVRLDLAAVTRHTLEQQHLAPERARTVDTLAVARDLAGLHATDPFSPYLQARARVPGFGRPMLDELLYGDRPLMARVGGMRGTLFMEPLDLLPIVFGATRRLRTRGRERFLAASGLTMADFEDTAGRVTRTLAGRALTARSLRQELGSERSLSAVLTLMCDDGTLVRWRPAAGPRDASSSYRLAVDALPDTDLGGLAEDQAVTRLVEVYLRRYGPASEADLAWWSGLDRARLRAALARLGPAVVEVGIEGLGDGYLAHREELPAIVPACSGPPSLALLPILDPYVMGYRDRRRLVDDRHLPFVYDRGGNGTSVILVGGRVAGTWDWLERPEPQVRIHLFEPASADLRAVLRLRASEVGAFICGRDVPVVEVRTMAPLTERAPWARSPLADGAVSL